MKIINYIKENKLFVFIIFVCFLFRVFKLNFQSPWADEVFTMINSGSDKSFTEIFGLLKNDVHPPLYYYIIHFFYLIFGDSCVIARMVSVIFGVAGVIALYFLANELFNKKVGIIAISLLCVNYYHIYYSQDARMYSLMFFSTTMSFLYLIRFIKTPTLRSVVLYAIFSTLMIYSHFFNLFILCSQYIIILYFLIKPTYNISQKRFLYLSFILGIITLVLYIPSLIILFTASKRDSIWIPLPDRDVFTTIFKEFFAFSEFALYIALLAIIYFFIKLFRRNQIKPYYVNPQEEKQTFAFVIIFPWITICFVIALILSYINLPMIISRYFINILPALIILVATGLYYIKNSLIRGILILSFILFSYTDLVFVKNYYSALTKTEYRQLSEFIISKHKQGEVVYTNLAIWLNYFLDKKMQLNQKESFDGLVTEMKNNNSNLPESFWIISADCGEFKITPESQTFLDEKYFISENFEGINTWAKHFKSVKFRSNDSGDLSKFKGVKTKYNGDAFAFNIENVEDNNEIMKLKGWAFFNDQDAVNSTINVVLVDENGELQIMNTGMNNRPDVTSYFKSSFNIDNSGFECVIDKNTIRTGNYKIALYIYDKKTKKQGLNLSNNILNKK